MRSTFAVVCITAATCIACGSHTVSSPGPSTTAAGSKTGSASGAPATGGNLSGSGQPWTADVSAAAKSDRSDAILQYPHRPRRVGQRQRAADRLLDLDLQRGCQHATDERGGNRGLLRWRPGLRQRARPRCRCPRMPTSADPRTFPATSPATPRARATANCSSSDRDAAEAVRDVPVDRRRARHQGPGVLHLGPQQASTRTTCAATSARAPTRAVSRSPR